MGIYTPIGKRRRRSVTDTLVEAEADHFRDCPNADFLIRVAATLLDFILFFLCFSGIQHIWQVIGSSLHFPGVPEAADIATLVFRFALVHFYCLWSVSEYGGTPAKLLLGLRVVDLESGALLNFPRVVLRELAGKAASLGILGIGFLMPLMRDDKRALHDVLSSSVVKRVDGPA